MKLHVPPGPLPVRPPFLEWDEGWEQSEDAFVDKDDEEIDLTDLLDLPGPSPRVNEERIPSQRPPLRWRLVEAFPEAGGGEGQPGRPSEE